MASVGIRQLPSGNFKVYWRLDDGSQGSQTFVDEGTAIAHRNRILVEWDEGTWIDPRRGRITFHEWAAQWWQTWAGDPDRSPNSLDSTESRLRLHIQPHFGPMQLRAIRPAHVKRWQNQLKGRLGHATVMGCRSILFRILKAAEEDDRIAANPVAKVAAPKKPVDLERRFGRAKRRTFTPEEFGYFFAAVPAFYRDHYLTQLGAGLRPSELLGLRVCRVDMARGHLEILEVRYEAGRFGSGYKQIPKSPASIRPVPMCPLVAEAVTRRVNAAGSRPDALVFPGPGGGSHTRRGDATGLTIGNYRRVFKTAITNLNAVDDHRYQMSHLSARGPHDFRATYATWLEDAGIPSRVIDELMGHEGGRPERGTSQMGALYRETTPVMLERVNAAIEQRLTMALEAAARLLPEMDERRAMRLRKGRR